MRGKNNDHKWKTIHLIDAGCSFAMAKNRARCAHCGKEEVVYHRGATRDTKEICLCSLCGIAEALQ